MKPDKQTLADMVANLRAQGGFSLEEVAGALNLSERTVLALSTKGSPYKKRWTPESVVREVLAFYDRTSRFPTSTDFRTWNERKMGLPSWDGLTLLMTGIHPRDRNRFYTRQDDLNRLERTTRAKLQNDHGVALPDGEHPLNGWDCLQWYMAEWSEELGLKARHLLAMPHVNARRRAMERYGWKRMCREAGAAIGTDEWGTLWRFQGPMRRDSTLGEPTVMLEAEESGRRTYFVRVPSNMRSPKQAAAWTHGITKGWRNFGVKPIKKVDW